MNNCKYCDRKEPCEGSYPEGCFHSLSPNREEGREPESVAFAKWLQHTDNGTTHYNPYTKEETQSIGFSPYDCYTDSLMTVEELYNRFVTLTSHSSPKELKGLEEISEEDKIEVLKLQGYNPEAIEILKNEPFYFDTSDGLDLCVSNLHDHYETVNIKTYRYLESKGYKI